MSNSEFAWLASVLIQIVEIQVIYPFEFVVRGSETHI